MPDRVFKDAVTQRSYAHCTAVTLEEAPVAVTKQNGVSHICIGNPVPARWNGEGTG
ncbi:MAG: hypothetical protein Q4B68_08075 [Bacteroidales bacterium]|nr:hypothetical protein [Bacteroidales bacterium]